MTNEPFLINPRRRKLRRKVRRLARVRRFKVRKLKKRFLKNSLGGELLLVGNPRRKQKIKKRSIKMARGRKKLRLGKLHRLSAYGSRHDLITSPFTRIVTGGQHINPRRRRYYRNPAGMLAGLGNIVPQVTGLLPTIAGGLVGYFGVTMLPKMILPVTWQTGTMKYVSKGIVVIGMTMVSGMVFKNKEIQKAILLGGLLSISIDLVGGLIGVPVSDVGMWISPNAIEKPTSKVVVGQNDRTDELY